MSTIHDVMNALESARMSAVLLGDEALLSAIQAAEAEAERRDTADYNRAYGLNESPEQVAHDLTATAQAWLDEAAAEEGWTRVVNNLSALRVEYRKSDRVVAVRYEPTALGVSSALRRDGQGRLRSTTAEEKAPVVHAWLTTSSAWTEDSSNEQA